jgi:hypothetical protein
MENNKVLTSKEYLKESAEAQKASASPIKAKEESKIEKWIFQNPHAPEKGTATAFITDDLTIVTKDGIYEFPEKMTEAEKIRLKGILTREGWIDKSVVKKNPPPEKVIFKNPVYTMAHPENGPENKLNGEIHVGGYDKERKEDWNIGILMEDSIVVVEGELVKEELLRSKFEILEVKEKGSSGCRKLSRTRTAEDPPFNKPSKKGEDKKEGEGK